MAHPAHQFGAGDHVCTNQRVHRLHSGSMGMIQRVSDTGAMFDVLFVGHQAPLLMFHEQLEAPPSKNRKTNLEGWTSRSVNASSASDAWITIALERLTMNTRMSYRYTDKTNCRQYTSMVVAGMITWEQIAPYLAKQGSFIPGQLGLEDLQHRFALPGGDHPWHQIAPDDIRPTEAAPTIALTAGELAERFGHTLWKADWLVAGAALKITVVRPAMPMDGTVHTYAHDKGSPQMRVARPLGRERHRLARN